MKKTIYLVRHCKAEGQEAEAPLTRKGEEDARALVQILKNVEIDHILSSPYKRALDTIKPLAQKLKLEIQKVEALKERVLSEVPMDDWLTKLEQTFLEKDLVFEGGESSRAALSRILEIIKEIVKNEHMKNVVIVSHGNLLSLLIQHYCPNFGFKEWSEMKNPDIFIVDFEDSQAKVTHRKIVWNEKNPVH